MPADESQLRKLSDRAQELVGELDELLCALGAAEGVRAVLVLAPLRPHLDDFEHRYEWPDADPRWTLRCETHREERR